MNTDVTHEPLKKALKHVKLGKCVSVDLIMCEEMGWFIPLLDKVFNVCFKYEIVPSAWYRDIINLIYD